MLVTFGVVQAASDAFVQAPGTLSALVPRGFGLRVYDALDRVAPAAYVEETLADDALAHGDVDRAEHFALRLDASSRRDDLLGRIAQARGDTTLALEYYLAAPDIERFQAGVAPMLLPQPLRGYELERSFLARMETLRTHPDAVADGHFFVAVYARALSHHDEALREYEAAVDLAPFNSKYVLSAANEALQDGDIAQARSYYNRTLAINPNCGDCYGGLGIIALRAGNRVDAQADAVKALRLQPDSGMLGELERELNAR